MALGALSLKDSENPSPRHPGQLYEAIAYFLLFFVGLWLYRKYPNKVGTGYFFGFCLTTIFTFRLFVEYFKEVQEPWELHMQNLIGLNQRTTPLTSLHGDWYLLSAWL